MTDPALRRRLEATFGHADWALSRRPGARLFVGGFALTGDELPGFGLRSQQVLQRPIDAAAPRRAARGSGAESLAAAPRGPRALRSFWSPPGAGDGIVLDLQSFECASRADAGVLLMMLLGEFESPGLQRCGDGEPGDVAFTTPRTGAALFVRGNMVHLLRNAGTRAIAVLEPAWRLDAAIATAPPTARRARAVPAATPLRAGRSAVLSIAPPAPRVRAGAAPDPEGLPPLKCFAHGGEVLWDGDSLVYRGDEPGTQEVNLYSFGADRGAPAVSHRMQFVVTRRRASP